MELVNKENQAWLVFITAVARHYLKKGSDRCLLYPFLPPKDLLMVLIDVLICNVY